MQDYVPDAGDIIWLRSEQEDAQKRAPRRTALVVSPADYNFRVGMIVCCSTSSRKKGHPFEVRVQGLPHTVVLADRVRRRDWRACRAVRRGQVSPEELEDVRTKLRGLFFEMALTAPPPIVPVRRGIMPQMLGLIRAIAPPTTLAP